MQEHSNLATQINTTYIAINAISKFQEKGKWMFVIFLKTNVFLSQRSKLARYSRQAGEL